MKKTILAFCTLCTLVACSKGNLTGGSIDASNVVFNFSINNQDDTKAVKSGWENGDCVFIFFEDVTTGYVSTVYNASSDDWETTLHGEASLSASGKKLTAVFLPFGSSLTPSYNGGWTFSEIQYTYYLVAEKVAYTISDTGDYSQLSSTLNMRNPEGYVQFFIEDTTDQTLYSDAVVPTGVGSISADGTLTEVQNLDENQCPLPMVGYTYSGGKLYSGKLADTQISAYVYPKAGYLYYFILSDQKHFHKILKEPLASHSAIKLQALSSGNWVQTGVECGVEMNGVIWATVNSGANEVWEYGDHFAWDELGQATRAGWHVPGFYPGGSEEDFKSLTETTKYWTRIKGITGQLIEEIANPYHFLFLPATGDWDGTAVTDLGVALNYWTSCEDDEEHAYEYYVLDGGSEDVYRDSKTQRYSLREVKD